jgi:hypothetical protein
MNSFELLRRFPRWIYTSTSCSYKGQLSSPPPSCINSYVPHNVLTHQIDLYNEYYQRTSGLCCEPYNFKQAGPSPENGGGKLPIRGMSLGQTALLTKRASYTMYRCRLREGSQKNFTVLQSEIFFRVMPGLGSEASIPTTPRLTTIPPRYLLSCACGVSRTLDRSSYHESFSHLVLNHECLWGTRSGYSVVLPTPRRRK